MTAIATFTAALDADLVEPVDGSGKRSVQVIGVALDDPAAGADRLSFLVVDHDGRGRLIPASGLAFTDDAVMPPKYGR
jgi:hypothetical protein